VISTLNNYFYRGKKMLNDYSGNPLTEEFEAFLEKEKTLACLTLQRADQLGDKIAQHHLFHGEWVTITWRSFGEQIRAVAKGLLELGVGVEDMIGVFAFNRAEWAIADLGILSTRAVTVPVYATNTAEEAEYIVDDAGVKIMFVGNQDQYDRVKSFIKKSKTLKKIIAIDSLIKIEGKDSIYFDDFLEMGRKSDKHGELEDRLNSVDSNDMLTIIYTSGTTGAPKGAVHTHKSFMCGIFASLQRFQNVDSSHITLAILPLSHVFERMWSYGVMCQGGQIAYCEDPKTFVETMAHIKPNYMTSVPRLWEKVYGTIMEGLETAPSFKKNLFNWAINTAKETYAARKEGKSGGVKFAIADALILKKIREKLGCGNVEVFHVGGAPFNSQINEFFCSIGIPLAMGFGLTEFFPVCVGDAQLLKFGVCGAVLPMVEMRTSEDGELQFKGIMGLKEYYNNPKATAETFTKDGWFKTGDIGLIEKEGNYSYIRITDRIKDIIITAGGKNIAPQQIELLLNDDLYIEQIAIIGDQKKYISALLVPSFEVLEEYAKSQKIRFASREELILKPEIIRFYADRIEERTKSLGQVEKIKKFTLLVNEFSQENGEITPTMKVKRKVINDHYCDVIDSMYE